MNTVIIFHTVCDLIREIRSLCVPVLLMQSCAVTASLHHFPLPHPSLSQCNAKQLSFLLSELVLSQVMDSLLRTMSKACR